MSAVTDEAMFEIITGTVEKSGVKFQLLVSDLVDVDDLAAIAMLIRRVGIKASNTIPGTPETDLSACGGMTSDGR